MASSYSTGSKHEVLWSLPIVDELAKETLDPSQLEKAEEIAFMFIGNRTQKTKAIFSLMKMVEPPPKRPLYYAMMELQGLPRWTRDAIRYLGDYIDLLVKA